MCASPNWTTTSGDFMFLLGPILNGWVIVWSNFASFVVIGSSFSPQDLLFDSLALVFLFQLDDIGTLGFTEHTDWPGRRLAWLYRDITTSCSHKTNMSFDDDPTLFQRRPTVIGRAATSVIGYFSAHRANDDGPIDS